MNQERKIYRKEVWPIPTDLKGLVRTINSLGYILERTGKHDLYRDDRGHRVTISQGVFMNPYTIRHICRNIERGYNVESERPAEYVPAPAPAFKNTPKIVDQPAPVVQKDETKVAMKHLSYTDVPRVKALLEDGMNYTKVAILLNKDGYRTITGCDITQSTISRLMIDNGVRLRNSKKDKPEVTKPEKEVLKKFTAPRVPIPTINKFLHDVQDLMTSNLSDELKEKFIRQLAAV